MPDEKPVKTQISIRRLKSASRQEGFCSLSASLGDAAAETSVIGGFYRRRDRVRSTPSEAIDSKLAQEIRHRRDRLAANEHHAVQYRIAPRGEKGIEVGDGAQVN